MTLTSDVLEVECVDGTGDWVDVVIADGAGTKNFETAEKSIVSHGEDLIGNPNVVSTLETIRSVSDPEVWKTWLVTLIILQIDLVDVKLREVHSHILEEVDEDRGTDIDALELQLGKVVEALDVGKAGVWQALGGPLLEVDTTVLLSGPLAVEAVGVESHEAEASELLGLSDELPESVLEINLAFVVKLLASHSELEMAD